MAGGGAPTQTAGAQAQTGAMAPATQTAVNPQAQGGMGGGMPQQAPQQQMSPQVAQQYFAQQRMAQQQQQMPQQQGQQGLQQLLANMMRQYQQPQMQQRAPQMRMQMPVYGQRAQGNPLAYRPDMTRAQTALRNVKPSVFKNDLTAAQARIAELEAQLAPAQTNDYYSGGG